MQTVTVAATRAFEHKGQSYRRGESVQCSAIDASILGRRGLVSLVKGEHGVQREPEPVQSAPTYSTRDLAADAPIIPSTSKRKRTYKRRDLVAESS